MPLSGSDWGRCLNYFPEMLASRSFSLTRTDRLLGPQQVTRLGCLPTASNWEVGWAARVPRPWRRAGWPSGSLGGSKPPFSVPQMPVGMCFSSHHCLLKLPESQELVGAFFPLVLCFQEKKKTNPHTNTPTIFLKDYIWPHKAFGVKMRNPGGLK